MLATGDETGLLKLVRISDDVVKTYGEQNRAKAIVGFSSITRSQFALARKDGCLEYWELSYDETEAYDLTYLRTTEVGSSSSGVVSLYATDKYDSASSLVYNEEGSFAIVNHSKSSEVLKSTVKGPISAVSSCSGGGVAFGGRENDLTFFDSNTQQVIWNAKNVPYDKLRLRVPIWITAISFFNAEQTSLSSGCKLVTGTGHKQVRLYDTRTEPRPIKSFEIGEYRVTQIQALSDEQNIYVSDTVGNVYHYDLRNGRRLHALTSSDGAVRHMATSDDEGTLVCVGLDRHARWHDVNTQKHVKSVYLRNRLNACLPMRDDHAPAAPKKGTKRSRQDDSDGERDEESVGDGSEDDLEDVDAFLGSENGDEDDSQQDGDSDEDGVEEEDSGDDNEDLEDEDDDEDLDDEDDEDDQSGSD